MGRRRVGRRAAGRRLIGPTRGVSSAAAQQQTTGVLSERLAVLRHTRTYNANDMEFTEALSSSIFPRRCPEWGVAELLAA